MTIAPLVPGFLSARRGDVGRLKAMLEAGDTEGMALLGHRLAGAGGAYGFHFISEVGFRIEEAARTDDHGALRDTVAALADYLDRLEIVFVEVPEEPAE